MRLLIALSVVMALARETSPATHQIPSPAPGQNAPQPQDALALQVTLDRASFSPGILDGHMGANTTKAQSMYQTNGGDINSMPEPVKTYRITAEDAAGPFIDRLPADMMALSKLPSLGYTSIVELLAERFHSTPALLSQLNQGVNLVADQEIKVPNVEPMVLPAAPDPATAAARPADMLQRPDVVVTVAKSTSALTVTDASSHIVFYAPVTTGSQHDPLPIGEWKVKGIQFNPTFRYNPDLFWDAEPSHTKATVPPGPNNPVGVVWIDLSKEHYGLHGTPEPATIGRTQSHGCVRLTNWDALKLASLVKPGTRVVFKE